MEFLKVVGTRRSVRWYKTWEAVPREKIQRILEVVRLCNSPGNIQPWRAVVVERDRLSDEVRDELLAADHWQCAHTQAPVWIYWYGDTLATSLEGFKRGMFDPINLPMFGPAGFRQFGITEERVKAVFEEGAEMPPGAPAMSALINGITPEAAVVLAMTETVGACTTALLAAVNEGLGTTLHMIATQDKQARVMELLKVPDHCVPVWLQLVGYPLEDRAAGGQRPRYPFEQLFFEGQYGTPFERDDAVVEQLRDEELIQAPMPTPSRMEELRFLARMYGYPES